MRGRGIIDWEMPSKLYIYYMHFATCIYGNSDVLYNKKIHKYILEVHWGKSLERDEITVFEKKSHPTWKIQMPGSIPEISMD